MIQHGGSRYQVSAVTCSEKIPSLQFFIVTQSIYISASENNVLDRNKLCFSTIEFGNYNLADLLDHFLPSFSLLTNVICFAIPAMEVNIIEITGTLELMIKKLGWAHLARELTTRGWNRLVLFGGEGINMEPMDDTFVLNLDAEFPEWHRMYVKSSPPGRWGHTLSCLNGSSLVVFGGYGRQGLLNDVFVLDLDAKQPTWREKSLSGERFQHLGLPPLGWGILFQLLGARKSSCSGLAKSGHLRQRSGDAYAIDLEDEKPRWIRMEWGVDNQNGHGHCNVLIWNLDHTGSSQRGVNLITVQTLF
ncbi:Adagio protein 3-like protein [Drosera capensis]